MRSGGVKPRLLPRTPRTTSPTMPSASSVVTLLVASASRSAAFSRIVAQWSAPDVGTNATTGANMPARLRRMSSASVLPFRHTMQTPMLTSAATKKAWTAV